MATRNRMPPWHEIFKAPSGHELLIRPIRPEDGAPLQAAFSLFGPEESVIVPAGGDRAVTGTTQRLTHPNPKTEITLVAAESLPAGEAVVGAVARASIIPGTREAEYAILISRFLIGQGLGRHLPLFFERTATLFDYLPDGSLPVVCTGAYEASVAFWAQTADRYEQRRHDVERPLLPPSALYLSPELLRERLNDAPRIEVWSADHARIADAHALGDQPLPPLPVAAREAPAGDALNPSSATIRAGY